MTTTIEIVCVGDRNVKRQVILESVSMRELKGQLQNLLDPNSFTKMGFMDNEGDFCRITSDVELLEAVNLSREMGHSALTLLVSGTSSLARFPTQDVKEDKKEPVAEERNAGSSIHFALKAFLADEKVVEELPSVIQAGLESAASSKNPSAWYKAMLGASSLIQNHPQAAILAPELEAFLQQLQTQHPHLYRLAREQDPSFVRAIPVLLSSVVEIMKSLDVTGVSSAEDLVAKIYKGLPFDIELHSTTPAPREQKRKRGYGHGAHYPKHVSAGTQCSNCQAELRGTYYHCKPCGDSANICPQCEEGHPIDHALLKLDTSILPPVIHRNVQCDGCKVAPIIGVRWNCSVCKNYDLCDECEQKGFTDSRHATKHPMIKLKTSRPRFHRRKFHNMSKKQESHQSVSVIRLSLVEPQVNEKKQSELEKKESAGAEEARGSSAEPSAPPPADPNDDDSAVAVAVAVAVNSPFADELESLAAMGFTNAEVTVPLLEEHSGDVQQVVNSLLRTV